MNKYPTSSKKLTAWVNHMAKLCQPDKIVWIDGSEKQRRVLEAQSVESGELIRLNQKKYPGCFLHRTRHDDVARTEHLTYVCTKTKQAAGPTNNWMPPKAAYKKARKYFQGAMKGRTMYVVPFSMGPVGSPFSKIGVELTDSRYVVLNMLIMTRAGEAALRQLEKEHDFTPLEVQRQRRWQSPKGDLPLTGFTKCLHSKADLDINKRLILHFPEDNAIWSVGSGYGGNVLLGKKCLALRIASYLGKKEKWLAEHMLIMGIEEPNGHIEYIAAAFPSSCGKTNLAMLLPPEGLKKKGYRIWTMGDDIAWMKIDTDGSLWAINPEKGFFGVAPGTNYKSNPNMMETIKKNTIYTNVLWHSGGSVWWEGLDGAPPKNGIDWMGRRWKYGALGADRKPIAGAHPNSRFTSPIAQCPTSSFRLDQHHGVPISAIIFGGRRAHLAPLVYQAFNWQHGVFLGATMASEQTAAAMGTTGKIRRDPMAMLPFCGYHMGEYFRHWLEMGKRMTHPPKIFHVNWFRTDEKGKFLWPGYGENLRVLEWILDRCRDEAKAVKTPIGYMPRPQDLDMTGLKLPPQTLKKLLKINPRDWAEELKSIQQFFSQFKQKFPKELWQEYAALRKRLKLRSVV